MTLKEIANLVNGELIGEEKIKIKGVAGIKEANEGEITFLSNPRYSNLVSQTRASAIITSESVEFSSKPLIRVKDPSLAFSEIVQRFHSKKPIHPEGIHPKAVIAKSANLKDGVAIGAYTVIEGGANIGENTIIYPNCYIGRDVQIGSNTLIYPFVSIRESVTVGSRVVIQSGTIVGSDGFGFITKGGKHQRIPQIGTVVIEDDVEIGANVTIDRARFDKTVIGKGTKIDNLVQIAHNVVIGENCIIVAQVGISGSTTIGDNVTIAGQAGIVGHISIGDNATIAAQAGVSKSVPANSVVWGCPAKPHSVAKRINACIQNLPRLYKKIEDIQKRIEELEKK